MNGQQQQTNWWEDQWSNLKGIPSAVGNVATDIVSTFNTPQTTQQQLANLQNYDVNAFVKTLNQDQLTKFQAMPQTEQLKFMQANNAPLMQQSWLSQNLSGLSNIGQGIGGLAQSWQGMQNLNLAKDQFDFQKSAWGQQYADQKAAYDREIADREARRAAAAR